MDKSEIEQMAENVAVQYMKVEREIEFVTTDVEILGGDDLGRVLVHGYNEESKKEMSVMMDYKDNYRVTSIGRNE